MLFGFTGRDGNDFDVELAGEGIDINFTDYDDCSQAIELKDEDKVRFATAILMLDRANDLIIEEFPLGERVRFGMQVMDVPRTEAGADAILERATALLATVGLYRDNVKRKQEEAARKKADAERAAQTAGIKAAIRQVNPFLNLSEKDVEILRAAGVRYDANV